LNRNGECSSGAIGTIWGPRVTSVNRFFPATILWTHRRINESDNRVLRIQGVDCQ